MNEPQIAVPHDDKIVFKFPPRAGLAAGSWLPAGTRISGRDGLFTLPRPALVNAMHFTGQRPNHGEWVMYYTFLAD